MAILVDFLAYGDVSKKGRNRWLEFATTRKRG